MERRRRVEGRGRSGIKNGKEKERREWKEGKGKFVRNEWKKRWQEKKEG